MSSNVETPKLRLYETVFVLNPVLNGEQIANIVQKFKIFFSRVGANLIYEEEIGFKKLAYPIQHKKTGFYQLFEFSAIPNVLIDLELAYRQDESVIRFLTCELDKHAIAYNKKKRGNDVHPIHVYSIADKPVD